MEFAAARIMRQFGGYTVESLLNEPLTVFLRLIELANRVQADEALEVTFLALNEALNGGSGEIFSLRRGNETLPSDKITPSVGDIERAKRIAEDIKNGIHGEIKTFRLEDFK